MQYAVELYFDAAMENELMSLVNAVAAAGISRSFLDWQTRPHLTLACFNDVNEEKCAARLKAFAKSHVALSAYIGSVGMFTDTCTIFVSPIMSQAMYQLQRELHAAMTGFDTAGWEWYLPDRWAPHCTVALTKDDGEDAFYAASALMLRKFKKLQGKFASIGLVKITRPVQEIFEETLI